MSLLGDPAPEDPGRSDQAWWRRLVGHPMVWLVGIWVGFNWWWLWVHRRSRVFELDEAGYAAMAARLSRQGTLDSIWTVVSSEGVHGPLQAIMAAPPQWLLGADSATLLWQNLLFGAGTAVAIYAMTKRLASPSAGVVAAAVALLSFGIIEHSRIAMTVMPSVFFAAVAMTAFVYGRGLEQTSWAVAAGAAIGCMTLSRSMTIGFVPVIGLAALGWSVSRRTPLRVVVRNGALAVSAGLAVALWWWVVQWPAVSEYLFGGGSADTAQNHDVFVKVRAHATDLRSYIGTSVVTTGLIAYAVLWLSGLLPAVRRWAQQDTAARLSTRSPDQRLAIWPLMASVVAGIAVLSSGSAFGVGFTMPGRLWWMWVPVVVVAAFVPSISPRGSGLTSPLWCGSDSPRSNCAVDTVSEGRAWSEAIVEVGDRIWQARGAAPDEWEFELALLSRDMLLNGNTLGLDAELRHQVPINFYRFFQPGISEEEQLLEMVQEADLLVVADDFRPGETILGTFQPDPQLVLEWARAAGFTPCGERSLPDGRTVTFLAAPDAPPATCAP
jgi:hypothetical protein